MTIQDHPQLGPHYASGIRALGRNVLPRGLVAVIENHEVLRRMIEELHTYANENRQSRRPRAGVVFRVVDAGEQQAIAHKIVTLAGTKLFNKEIFQVNVGWWHILDDSALSHACNRHSDPEIEAMHGHSAVTLDDYQQIALVVRPQNIINFTITKGMPRIVYRRTNNNGELTVVQEIQARSMAVKTVCKK